MPSKTLQMMTPSQRWDALASLWPVLDTVGQSLLVRLGWALAMACDDGEDVKAIGRAVGLLANDNESPDNTIATC